MGPEQAVQAGTLDSSRALAVQYPVDERVRVIGGILIPSTSPVFLSRLPLPEGRRPFVTRHAHRRSPMPAR
jgi:hypothetical protein